MCFIPVWSIAVGCSSRASRYWWLNNPFCCIHRSRDSQCFSVGRTTLKITISHGWSEPYVIIVSLGPHESTPLPSNDISICLPVLRRSSVYPTQWHTDTHTHTRTHTHTQTTLRGTSVAIIRIWCIAGRRCGLKTQIGATALYSVLRMFSN